MLSLGHGPSSASATRSSPSSARRNFLFFQNETWVKRQNADFDVGMEYPDSAQISELCGLFLLSEMLMPKEELDLYRDDGLAVVELPGPKTEGLRKNILKLFSKHNLRITTEAHIKTTDFLDVQFCLESGVNMPFKKDSSLPLYAPFLSNHHGHVKKEIPKMIINRCQTYHLVRMSFCMSRHSTTRPSGWPDTRRSWSTKSPKVTTGGRERGRLRGSTPRSTYRSAPTSPENSCQ